MEGATCLLRTEQLYKERDKRALVQVWNVGKKHKDLVRIKEANGGNQELLKDGGLQLA